MTRRGSIYYVRRPSGTDPACDVVHDVETFRLDYASPDDLVAVVTGDGYVHMHVRPELSDGVVQNGLPPKTTTEVDTDVLVQDGQTLLIGGLIREREERTRRGIPGLVRIPWLGALFGRTVTSLQRAELITVLTPRILRPGEDVPARSAMQSQALGPDARAPRHVSDRVAPVATGSEEIEPEG